MNDQSQKPPDELKVQQNNSEITLTDLIRNAEPLLEKWTKSENEKHRMELEYENKKYSLELEYDNNLLQSIAKQNRLMTFGLLAILFFVLIIAGGLFFSGKDSTAMDLIKLIIGLGGAAFGGYGWAMGRRRTDDEEI